MTPRPPEEGRALAESVEQLGTTAAACSRSPGAGATPRRATNRGSLQARQSDLSTAGGDSCCRTMKARRRTAQRVSGHLCRRARQVYWFLSAIPPMAAIAATGLYLIHANRTLFAPPERVVRRSAELAQTLIATRESTLREISRELHDEVGQLFDGDSDRCSAAPAAIPGGLDPARRPAGISEVAQTALDNVRGLSQTLHPSILDEPLESAIEWYLRRSERNSMVSRSITTTPAARSPAARQRHPRLPRAAGRNQQHRPSLLGPPGPGVRLHHADVRCSSRSRIRAHGLDEQHTGRGLGLVAMPRAGRAPRRRAESIVPGWGDPLRLYVPLESASA